MWRDSGGGGIVEVEEIVGVVLITEVDNSMREEK